MLRKGVYKQTEEHKKAISEGTKGKNLGIPKSLEHRKNIQKVMLGNKHALKHKGVTGNDKRLRLWYNITQDQYDELLRKQDGHCACCNKTPKDEGRALSIDHDHKVFPVVVRGLLCGSCNRALGLLKDNAYTAYKMCQYLEKSI